MSAPAFTPGPWKYVPNGVRTIDDAYVCELSCPRGSDERDATARLIAAAPEMYEALEWLLAHKDECLGDYPGYWAQFSVLCRKIRGEQ